MANLSKLLFGLLPVLTATACYNTSSVENGGLACSSGNGCPDGFACQSDGHCWKNGTGPVTCDTPFGPFTNCSAGQAPAGSTCDPVCQSGCSCGHRCVLDSATASKFVCEATTAPTASFIEPGSTCADPYTTQCAPGSVCIADDTQACPNLCYQTCRANADCPPNTYCSKTSIYSGGGPISGVYLCSPPVETCSPTGAASCGSDRSGFACVFLAGLTGVALSDATVCDCASLHTEKVGAACAKSAPDNCEPGAVCVSGRCRTICNRSGTGVVCPSGSTCTAIYNSSQYGYCP